MGVFLPARASPTFSLFSWHTCLLGVASCLLMMFLISPGAAGGSLLLMGLLSALLTARGGPSSWGYVSQALLFHQVGASVGGREGGRQSWGPPPGAQKAECSLVVLPTTHACSAGSEVPAPPGRPQGAREVLAAAAAAPGGEPTRRAASAAPGQPAEEGRPLRAGPRHARGPR